MSRDAVTPRSVSPPPALSALTPMLAIGSLLWTGGVFLSPLLLTHGHETAGVLARVFYGPVCHQVVARSFSCWGAPLAVCQRCVSIYATFTLTVMVWMARAYTGRGWRRFSLSAAVVFLLPMLMDYVCDVLGIWHNSPISRAVSGAAAGTGLGLLLAPAWNEAVAQLRAWRRTHRLKEKMHG
jgi:uncharacterized membrane protein